MIRWAVGLSVLALSPFLPASWLQAAALLAVLTLGVAHGAVDPVLAREGHRARFYLRYLTGAAAVLFLWWLVPPLAFAMFLLISVLHFGEGDVRRFRSPTLATVVSRGAMIVGVPLFLHPEEVRPVVAALGVALPPWGDEMAIAAVALVLLHLALAYRAEGLRAALDTILLAVLFWRLPVLVSFGLYFTVWHAADHLRDVREVVSKGMFRHALLWTLVSWVGMALFAAFTTRWVAPEQRWSVVFGFLSAVTVPHVVVVAGAGLGRRRDVAA